MRKLSTAVLIGGLLAVFVVAGCGGGGGGGGTSNGGGGGGSTSAVVLTGNVVTSSGSPAGVGYTITFTLTDGKTTLEGKTNASGAFQIQLQQGDSLKSLYPDISYYKFSVKYVPVSGMPETPIWSIEYPYSSGIEYTNQYAIDGPLALWTTDTTGTFSMGTIRVD